MSAAVFWLREFHIDGIKFNVFEDNAWRVDEMNLCEDDYFEVANMLKAINLRIENKFVDCLKISGELPEKIRAANRITKGNDCIGLCFDFALNQNWCKSLFEDKQNEQGIQKYKYGKLGYTLMCAFDERYILPITANDVSSGRGSLISKMKGEYTEKFRKIKMLLTYMMLHPGKKSVFMGCEIGEMHEWEKRGQIEWFLTDYPLHKELKNHCRRLNKIYAENSALWANDNSWVGFEWYESKGLEQGIMCFARIGEKNRRVVGIFNFSENSVFDFSLSNMNIKNAKILLSTGYESNENIDVDSPLDLPPISALVLQIQNLEE
jgi:1,4-alpha-glucan branching enzyme